MSKQKREYQSPHRKGKTKVQIRIGKSKSVEKKSCHDVKSGQNMDNGYMIREKIHQTSKVWAFWVCQSAAQTKSIYVEKNVAQIIRNCTFTLEIREI